jgi:A/G-specific adenine glycosylase
MEPGEVLNLPQTKRFIAEDSKVELIYPIRKHVLTHQHLYVRFIEIAGFKNELEGDYFFVEENKLKNLVLPQIIFIFLTNFLN